MIDIPTLVSQLGTNFFVPFLVGMFGGFLTTRSVYIGLAAGAAVGCIFWLLL